MNIWVVPCNTRYYDYKRAFEALDCLNWKQSANMKKGDIVFIYVGRPVSSLMYKCEIIDIELDSKDCDDSTYIIGSIEKKVRKYMKLRVDERYSEGVFDRKNLLENGLKTIQGPSKVEIGFLEYINKNIH